MKATTNEKIGFVGRREGIAAIATQPSFSRERTDGALSGGYRRQGTGDHCRLSRPSWMIATAESCTGGLIAGALTEIAGSSAVVDRGFVTYTNQAKIDLIGVSPTNTRRVRGRLAGNRAADGTWSAYALRCPGGRCGDGHCRAGRRLDGETGRACASGVEDPKRADRPPGDALR